MSCQTYGRFIQVKPLFLDGREQACPSFLNPFSDVSGLLDIEDIVIQFLLLFENSFAYGDARLLVMHFASVVIFQVQRLQSFEYFDLTEYGFMVRSLMPSLPSLL